MPGSKTSTVSTHLHGTELNQFLFSFAVLKVIHAVENSGNPRRLSRKKQKTAVPNANPFISYKAPRGTDTVGELQWEVN